MGHRAAPEGPARDSDKAYRASVRLARLDTGLWSKSDFLIHIYYCIVSIKNATLNINYGQLGYDIITFLGVHLEKSALESDPFNLHFVFNWFTHFKEDEYVYNLYDTAGNFFTKELGSCGVTIQERNCKPQSHPHYHISSLLHSSKTERLL